MLSNIFVRLLTSVRPIHNYQQHFVRLLSTAEATSNETSSSSNREKGVVKRFSKEKGFGFISKTSDGTDYFVHFKNINATGFRLLEQGQEVEFTATQGEKGLEAKDVSILSTGTGRRSFLERSFNDELPQSKTNFGKFSRNQSSSSSSFNFGGTRSSKLNSNEQESTSTEKAFKFSENLTNSSKDNFFSSKKPQITNEQTREFGSVKRWTPERGFGFIRRTNSNQDLFCHVRSLKDGVQSLEPGQTVEFSIHQTDKGEEARDVVIVKDDSLQNQQQDSSSTANLGERQTGTVKKWLTGRGYGFVARDTGGPDVFVHVRNLTNGIQSLEEGQIVEFNIIKNEKGETAQNITVLSEKSETSDTM
ncbi:unnamed protein product [Rotaria sp. Silwood1]|nr:unnamed protein product [Rotaria sp. Silwood1]CAF1360175.1 unnamed protein product [Rotaria sp. Silwood1]CAF3558918.1 unnamed protein product [Rotaria sp. Silwood1]